MGYLTRKMGRRTGWATAAMLFLLAGTSRAQSDPTHQVTIDANGDINTGSFLASNSLPEPVDEASAEETRRVAGEMWTELAKHEVEHSKAHAHTGPLANVRERGKEFRQHRDREVDRYYTANRIYDRFFESDIGCPFLEVTRAALMTLTVNMTSILTQREPWPVNGMVQPPDLQDVRPAPFEFGEDIRQTERPAYYFAYRILQNLYYYAQTHWYGEPLLRVPGWTEQKVHFFHEDILQFETFERTPMAMTIYNAERETVFLVIRGTMSRQEWYWDYQVNYAEGAARTMFPGRVARGVFTVFQMLRESVMCEVDRLKPKRIVVTGHSLGGALSIIFSWYIKSQFPHIQVDCLAFAPIAAGDETFFEALRPAVNLRSIVYLGPGWDGALFRAGDTVMQPGHSAPFPGCPGMETGTEDDRWQYALPGGFIRFTSEEMPNPETWKKVENTMLPTIFKIIATHVCAYTCWTSHPYDAESHCFFPGEKEGLAERAYCNVETIIGQLIDNTGVNTRPLTPPNRKLMRGG